MNLRALAAALLLLLSASLSIAQTSTGEVNGTITDPNGSALPGTMVKLINQATKIETDVKTNDGGYFTIINVKPGSYVLRVEVRNFKGLQTAPFTVGVSETITQNLQLTLGEVSETVEVTADAEVVQRTRGLQHGPVGVQEFSDQGRHEATVSYGDVQCVQYSKLGCSVSTDDQCS